MEQTGKEATEVARKRLAIEIIAQHERTLQQTARRYSLCVADAEDAYQRALEILLTKAPAVDARELIRWMQTVTKHEALAVRRNRERLLAASPSSPDRAEDEEDWIALIPAQSDGPPERAERREAIARSREALQALKPAELKALTLLAEGYSYTEISELTGFTRTKVNRCLAEGRERFRALLSRSQDGSRCAELRPLLSAFCDGEAGAKEVAVVREHLRACASCRAAMRAYKAAPGAAAALAPGLPVARSILERLHEAFSELHSRLPMRGGAESAAQVAASGGAGSGGIAALAKVVAVCAGAAGGTAACIATGVVPAPLDLAAGTSPPAVERQLGHSPARSSAEAVEYEPTPAPEPAPPPGPTPKPPKKQAVEEEPVAGSTETGAVEYPQPTAAPTPTSVEAPTSSAESATASSGSPAGEFGP